MSLWDYFTDPILRAPTWGCLFMCLSASLTGVVIFLRGRLLVAESLSHASYPGAVVGIAFCSLFFPQAEEGSLFAALGGALATSALALWAIEWLQRKGKVRSDAALCFVLSVFFGFGVVLATALQGAHPSWLKQVQMLLFGQAATMTDFHIAIYGSLALGSTLLISAIFHPLQAVLFDAAFAKSLGIRTAAIERLIFALLLLSIVIGIRSVGVILMSGMLIAPAVAARQYSQRLSTIFFLSALFGSASAFVGHILSVEGSIRWNCSLPTGPLIVLVGAVWALFSLAFAPKRGALFRLFRILTFRLRCQEENILKYLWKMKQGKREEFRRLGNTSRLGLIWLLFRMKNQGWLAVESSTFRLTRDGEARASSVVRLHRLWEVYLTHLLGREAGTVHRIAEEMEHILTPEMEKRLTQLLADPKKDPHQQPIPERRGIGS